MPTIGHAHGGARCAWPIYPLWRLKSATRARARHACAIDGAAHATAALLASVPLTPPPNLLSVNVEIQSFKLKLNCISRISNAFVARHTDHARNLAHPPDLPAL